MKSNPWHLSEMGFSWTPIISKHCNTSANKEPRRRLSGIIERIMPPWTKWYCTTDVLTFSFTFPVSWVSFSWVQAYLRKSDSHAQLATVYTLLGEGASHIKYRQYRIGWVAMIRKNKHAPNFWESISLWVKIIRNRQWKIALYSQPTTISNHYQWVTHRKLWNNQQPLTLLICILVSGEVQVSDKEFSVGLVFGDKVTASSHIARHLATSQWCVTGPWGSTSYWNKRARKSAGGQQVILYSRNLDFPCFCAGFFFYHYQFQRMKTQSSRVPLKFSLRIQCIFRCF